MAGLGGRVLVTSCRRLSADSSPSPLHWAPSCLCSYMTRLGMFGFKDAREMIDLLNHSRLGALELAAMSLKATGSYLSRTLSYEGAEFVLAYVDIDPVFRIM